LDFILGLILIGLKFSLMNHFLDEDKMKDFVQIFSLDRNEHFESKLIQFERENASIFYYTKLMIDSVEDEVLKFISERIKTLNVHKDEEIIIKEFINTGSIDETLFLFLGKYFSHKSRTMNFLLVVENMNLNSFDFLLKIIYMLKLDFKLILKIYISLISNKFISNRFDLLTKILVNEDTLEFEYKFHQLYPAFKLILMDQIQTPISEDYLDFLKIILPLVPHQDLSKILEIIEMKYFFKSENNILDFFYYLFDEYSARIEEFSSRYF
jgi:hypothetical protein